MRVARWTLGLATVAALALAFAIHAPYWGFAGEALVDIPSGTRTVQVARMLEEQRVIRSRWEFLAVRALRPRATLQAGEYLFLRSASAWQVFRRLEAGDVFYYEITVPEGNNLFDIAGALDNLGTIRGEDFLAVARDPAPIRDLAPEAVTLEGYLFPDTYRITRQTTAAELCLRMTNRFREVWSKLNAGGPAHPVVTLASLIEKETASDAERPLISSVFHNRLGRMMALDCDPTAIYAALLEGRYKGELLQADLDSRSRYNTYQHAGLPPGPIANPGLSSLKAALDPADTDYLFFVAKPDGSGTHTFSKELDAHNLAVGRYRRATKKNNQAGAGRPVPSGKPAKPRR